MDSKGLLSGGHEDDVAKAVPVVAYASGPSMGMPAVAVASAVPASMAAQYAVAVPGVGGVQYAASVQVGGAVGHGLGALANVQGLCIRQKIRLAELLTGWEQKNRFKIMVKPATMVVDAPLPDEIAQQLPPIFWAVEDSECCQRQVCHNYREFTMNIFNALNEQVLTLHRPFKCTGVCPALCVCNPTELIVSVTNGMCMGRIVQQVKACNCDHFFEIFDGAGLLAFTIHIPICECWATPRPTCCCSLWTAQVVRGDGSSAQPSAATLQNIWPGCNIRGLLTKADNFQINYLDPALSVDDKTLIFCSMFLIDMVYFEVRQNSNSQQY